MISEALSTYTESSLMITLIAVSCSTDNKQTKKHMPLKQYLDSCMDGGGISVAVIMNCVGFTARNGEREVLVWTYFPPLCILLPSPSPFPFCHSLSPSAKQPGGLGEHCKLPQWSSGRAPGANVCDILSPENAFGGNKTVSMYGSRQKELPTKEVLACHTAPHRPTSSTGMVCDEQLSLLL